MVHRCVPLVGAKEDPGRNKLGEVVYCWRSPAYSRTGYTSQSTVWFTTVPSTYAGDSEDVIVCGLLCVWQPGLQDRRMHFGTR